MYSVEKTHGSGISGILFSFIENTFHVFYFGSGICGTLKSYSASTEDTFYATSIEIVLYRSIECVLYTLYRYYFSVSIDNSFIDL